MGGFADYYNKTTLHPVGFVSVLVLGVAIVLLPRRYAILPMILLGCLIPSAQRIIVMGADFTLLRILVLFAWLRLVVQNEFQGFAWNRLDTMVVAWKATGTIVYTVSYGTAAAFIYRCGWVFEGLGMYFFFRCVLRDWEDIRRLAYSFMIVSIPVAGAFLLELSTHRNVFAVFGGVHAVTQMRDERFRCQGAFSHPILAGCYWAGVLPYILAYVRGSGRFLGTVGCACSVIIAMACASSTPLLSLAFVALGMGLYGCRRHIRLIRWGFFATLVILHLVMNHPVWHLLARINVVSGSTGYHRYKIMDATINNFSKWWLLGEHNPASWGVWQMRDITNQYILEALRGGLLTLSAFVIMIAVSFGIVGRTLKSLDSGSPNIMVVWCIGVSLFVHVGSYFGVSYFGQIMMIWYLTLALIGSLPGVASGVSEETKVEKVGD